MSVRDQNQKGDLSSSMPPGVWHNSVFASESCSSCNTNRREGSCSVFGCSEHRDYITLAVLTGRAFQSGALSL